MKRRILTILTLACALSAAAGAAEQKLEELLTAQYRDEVLFLRHCFISRSQEYDFEGRPLDASDEGPWSLYGRIVVKKIAAESDKLRVEGNRAVYSFDGRGRGRGLMPFVERDRVKIAIRLNSPLTSGDQAADILSRVFAVTQEDMVNSAPPFWRAYLAKQAAVAQALKKGESQNAFAVQNRPLDDAATAGDSADEKVFKLGEPGVTAPKVLYAPEPQFSAEARNRSLGGVVGLNVIVDSTGRVSHVTISKPVGMGLDEEAVKTVSAWRFTPAMHDGQPVAIAVYIEADFHLYNRR